MKTEFVTRLIKKDGRVEAFREPAVPQARPKRCQAGSRPRRLQSKNSAI